MTRGMALTRGLFAALLLTLGGTGCVKKIALNAVADGLTSGTGSTFASDEDLQFVGDAIPFALKLMESLHESLPEHVGLHESLCSGFTQYGAVYVQFPATQLKYEDYEAHRAGLARARGFYKRARGYGLGGLDLLHPGFASDDPDVHAAALAETTAEDVSLLYWTGAAWLAAISVSKEDPELIGQLPQAAALLHRALELDPEWEDGSIHDMLIVVEPSMPMPGGDERAREHFRRAVELSDGRRASPYVSLATTVSVAEQDREEFVSLLESALAVDPDISPADRLANLYAQAQARYYLDHIDDLFI